MSYSPKIIGVSGFARAGKDTFVKIARKIFEFQGFATKRLAFADELKNDIDAWLIDKYGISAWTDDTDEKELIRPFLVAHGCGKRKQTMGQYWISKIEDVVFRNDGNDNLIYFISDVRFPNEARWLHQRFGGWLVHLKKYSVKRGTQFDSFTGKATEIREWKQFDEAPNTEEAENDPIVASVADFRLEFENAIERELRLTGNKITTEMLLDNSYLNEEITKCLKHCPFLTTPKT